jgi:hypothetical protein
MDVCSTPESGRWFGKAVMSVTGQKQTLRVLFDHFVGEGQEILGQLNACSLRRLDIDY